MVTRLGDVGLLMRALNAYGEDAERAVVRGMRKAARFGHTAVQHTYTRTRDPFKIRASGSYGQAFITQDIPEGAILANAMFYAVFVERGRKKGRPPPFDPILEWVYQKRISARPKPITKPRKPRARKPAPKTPKPDRAAGVDDSRSKAASDAPADKPTGIKKYTKAERAQRKIDRRKKKAARIRKQRAKKQAMKKRFLANQRAVANATGIANAVRWKIARHGTKGRWVVRRTMPKIAKRAVREIKREISILNKNPPRG